METTNFESQNPIPDIEIPILPSTPTPNKNIFKILFFVFLGLFLIISLIYAYLWVKSDQQTQNSKTETQNQITKTIIPTETQTSTPIPTQTASIIPTKNPIQNWKTYSNTKYGYSINYPNIWTFREFPDINDGAGFRLSTSINDLKNEFINIDEMGRGESYQKMVFDEYVKNAGPYEIENYNSLATIEKITTNTGIIGYKVTWNFTDRNGKEQVSLPITYFDTKKSNGDTVQVSLNNKNYLDDYNKMILTFKFN